MFHIFMKVHTYTHKLKLKSKCINDHRFIMNQYFFPVHCKWSCWWGNHHSSELLNYSSSAWSILLRSYFLILLFVVKLFSNSDTNAPLFFHKVESVHDNRLFAHWHFFHHIVTDDSFNPLNPKLNPICYLLALLGAHHFLHVSRIRVKLLTFRLLMSYIWSTHSWCF